MKAKKIELLFKVKDVFPVTDSLAMWILKLSMARSDISRLHIRLFALVGQEDIKAHAEQMYLVRMSVGHMREAIKVLYQLDDSFFSRIIFEGERNHETSYIFADEIALNLSFGEMKSDEFVNAIEVLSDYMQSFLSFCDQVLAVYVTSKQSRMRRITTR